MWLLRLPGVYRPQADTWLLQAALEAAGVPRGGSALDAGCGCGALAVVLGRRGAGAVTAVDLSRRAVWATWANTSLRRLPVRVRRADAWGGREQHRYDLIVANPPYVPGRGPKPPTPRSRAWEGGADGRAWLDRLCAKAPSMLHPGGVLLFVQSAIVGVEKSLRQLRESGLKSAIVARTWIPFGPVMRSRCSFLEQQGLIEPGEQTEELVVIRGERPLGPERRPARGTGPGTGSDGPGPS